MKPRGGEHPLTVSNFSLRLSPLVHLMCCLICAVSFSFMSILLSMNMFLCLWFIFGTNILQEVEEVEYSLGNNTPFVKK